MPDVSSRAGLWASRVCRESRISLQISYGRIYAPHAPNANAFAERWVRTLRTDCLDRILILGRRHLEQVLRVYRRHYNEHRPHRALHLLPPNGRDPTPLNTNAGLRRRDLLGGLIHEYEAA